MKNLSKFIEMLYTETSFFLIVSSIALSTTFFGSARKYFLYQAIDEFSSATLKKFVAAGPGQTAVTYIFFFFNSTFKALEKLKT